MAPLRRGGVLLALAVSFARELAGHPWQLLLSLMGIALGVAVVLAIELASQGAHRSFQLANDAVMGATTHVITGSDLGVPHKVLRQSRAHPGVIIAAPVVEATGELQGRKVQVIGVDPLTEARFGRLGFGPSRQEGAAREGALMPLIGPVGSGAAGVPGELNAAVVSGRGALLAELTAQELGLEQGESFTVRVGGRDIDFVLVGVFGEPSGAQTLVDIVVADVAGAASMLGRPGHFSRIDLIVSDERTARALAAKLPASTRLRPAGDHRDTRRQMTRAFELNLRMMSLLSLVVGVLLIYNTAHFSISRRRETLATLRALGVSRNELFGSLLIEAWAVGLVGASIGVVLGEELGQAVLTLVTRTMHDLYFVAEVRQASLGPGWTGLGIALGAGVTVLGSMYPLWRASETVPRLSFARTGLPAPSRHAMRIAGGLGAVFIVVAVLLVGYRPEPGAPGLMAGYAGLAAGLVGCALLVPGIAALVLGMLRRTQRRSMHPIWITAVGGLETHLGQVIIAVIALMIALAAAVGVGVMVDSFRSSVRGWLDAALPADIYVTTDSRAAPRIPRSAVADLRGVAGVEAVSAGLWTSVQASAAPVRVLALVPAPESAAAFPLLSGIAEPWEEWVAGRGILVSEPLAFKQGLRTGDRLTLDAEAGSQGLPVLGVFRDYRSERGFALMHRSLFNRLWPQSAQAPGYTGLGVYVSNALEPRERERVRADIEMQLVERGLAVSVKSNESLREYSMRVFNRTFAVTDVLRWITAAVAFFAVLGSTLALEIARSRERALLRAIGFTRLQTGAAIEAECLLQGLLAGLLAVPVGSALSWLLIEVVNRRSFGWGMDIDFDPATFALAVLSAALASLLAGIVPAYRAACSDPGRVMRLE